VPVVNESVTRFSLRWLWVALPAIAVAEIVLQCRIPGRIPSEEDWRAAAEAISAERTDRDLVVIAPDWAVQGRVHLEAQIGRRDIGRFDTSRYDRLFEVSFRGERAPESAGLEPESTAGFGEITLRRYDLPPAADVVYDLLDELDRCRCERMRRPHPRFLVDHRWRTRLVIPVRLRRRPVSLSFDDVPLGTVLHGWAIVGRRDYREHSLPRGGPIRLAVSLDGERLDEIQVSNFGPPEPFDIALPGAGSGTLRLEVSAPDHFERSFGFFADVRRIEEAEP
jgi:hypothetical protein